MSKHEEEKSADSITAAESKETENSNPDEQSISKKTSRRRLIAGAIGAGVVVLAGIFLVVGILSTPEVITIEDSEVPLTMLPSGSASSGISSSEMASSGIESSSTNASESADELSEPNTGSTGSEGIANGNTADVNTPADRVWVPGWDEQVWVDTSSWQSVHVGDNPIIEYHSVCNYCGAIISGFAGQHLLDTGHGSYSNNVPVQVGSTPIYENQWVTSGYWTTVHHEGYWQ